MFKKKQEGNYTGNMQNNTEDKNPIIMGFNRAFAIIAATAISCLVGGAFAGYSISRSTAFTANANAQDIKEIKEEYIRKDVVEPQLKTICETLSRIEGKLDNHLNIQP